METVQVIIPTINRPKLLDDLLKVVNKSKFVTKISVINTSGKPLKLGFKNVELINNSNFLQAKNLVAKKSECSWVLFLDDDIKVDLTTLNNFLSKSLGGKFDACTCFVKANTKYKFDLIKIVQFAKLSFYGVASLNEQKVPQKDYRPDFFPGCFMLIKTRAFKDIGGFDKSYRFPFYNEDTDLTYRICKNKNNNVVLFPKITVKHLKSIGGIRTEIDKNIWFYNFGFNNSYFLVKNFGIYKYILYSLFRFRDHLFVVKQKDTKIYKSYIGGIKNGFSKARKN